MSQNNHNKASTARRIGVLGYGFIGQHLVKMIRDNPNWGLELAFVWNRDASKLAALPPQQVLASPADAAATNVDLIVECAHPQLTIDHGENFLSFSDYLPLSVSALADAALKSRLLKAAQTSGRRLFIPHGALIGLDNLVEVREMWEEVTITFRKNPANIDFSDSGYDTAQIRGETRVFDGSVREISRLYPRNVNTMTTCALATVGLDQCRAVLVADPALDVAIAEVRAVGKDGSIHESRKIQPVVGVSGTEMLAAQVGSVLRAAQVFQPGLNFV